MLIVHLDEVCADYNRRVVDLGVSTNNQTGYLVAQSSDPNKGFVGDCGILFNFFPYQRGWTNTTEEAEEWKSWKSFIQFPMKKI